MFIILRDENEARTVIGFALTRETATSKILEYSVANRSSSNTGDFVIMNNHEQENDTTNDQYYIVCNADGTVTEHKKTVLVTKGYIYGETKEEKESVVATYTIIELSDEVRKQYDKLVESTKIAQTQLPAVVKPVMQPVIQPVTQPIANFEPYNSYSPYCNINGPYIGTDGELRFGMQQFNNNVSSIMYDTLKNPCYDIRGAPQIASVTQIPVCCDSLEKQRLQGNNTHSAVNTYNEFARILRQDENKLVYSTQRPTDLNFALDGTDTRPQPVAKVAMSHDNNHHYDDDDYSEF